MLLSSTCNTHEAFGRRLTKLWHQTEGWVELYDVDVGHAIMLIMIIIGTSH